MPMPSGPLPERLAERQRMAVDPNPHLRRDRYARARLARAVADIQRVEVLSMPGNFLPPEQRTTTTTPAGESAYKIPDSRPEAHLNVTTERLRREVFAREIGSAHELSGSTTSTPTPDTSTCRPSSPRRGPPRCGGPPPEEIKWAKAHKQPDG